MLTRERTGFLFGVRDYYIYLYIFSDFQKCVLHKMLIINNKALVYIYIIDRERDDR